MVSVAFLKGADKKKYGSLWSELENNFTRGKDEYPSDLTGAYNVLLNYKTPNTSQPLRNQENDGGEVTGVSLLQHGTVVAGTDGVTHARTKCYSCNLLGHFADMCPQANGGQEEVQLFQMESDENSATGSESEYYSEFTFVVVEDKSTTGILFHQQQKKGGSHP